MSILRRAPNVMVAAIAAASCAAPMGCADPAGEVSPATDVGVPGIAPAAAQERSPVAGTTAPPPPSRLIGEPAPPEPDRVVTLIDPGREPRSLLRYTAARGARQRVYIKGSGTSEVQVGGRRVYSQAEAATEAWFEVTVVAAETDRLECEIRFERAMTNDWDKFEPGRATQLRRSLDRLGEHPYRFAMDRRGQVEQPPLVLPPEVDQEGDRNMAWAILEEAARSVIALPVEPVGIGARWRIVEEDRGRVNMAARVSIDLELVARRGSRLEMKSTIEYLVQPQVIDLRGGLVSGVSRMRSTLRGPAVIDLAMLQAVDWRIDTDFVMDGTWLQLGERLPMRVLASGTSSVTSR